MGSAVVRRTTAFLRDRLGSGVESTARVEQVAAEATLATKTRSRGGLRAASLVEVEGDQLRAALGVAYRRLRRRDHPAAAAGALTCPQPPREVRMRKGLMLAVVLAVVVPSTAQAAGTAWKRDPHHGPDPDLGGRVLR